VARILLDVDEPTTRLTLKAMLEAAGHRVVAEAPQAVIADTAPKAVAYAREHPSLVLAHAPDVRDAVLAMHKGVYGYVFLPLQPGEAVLMVERAIRERALGEWGVESAAAPDAGPRLDQAEARLILDVLRQCRNNKTRAAQKLGIGRNTLWRKLKRIREAGEDPGQ